MESRLFQPKIDKKSDILEQLSDVSICTRINLEQLDEMVREYLHDPNEKQAFYVALKKIEEKIPGIADSKITFDELFDYLIAHFGIAGRFSSMTLLIAMASYDYATRVEFFAELIALEKTLQQDSDCDALILINLLAPPTFIFENGHLYLDNTTEGLILSEADGFEGFHFKDKISVAEVAKLFLIFAESIDLVMSPDEGETTVEAAELTELVRALNPEKKDYEVNPEKLSKLDEMFKTQKIDIANFTTPDLEKFLHDAEGKADQLLIEIKSDQCLTTLTR